MSRVSGCRVVSFINGGKCGSTALASMLKHAPPRYENWDPTLPFDDGGKEICWSSGDANSFSRNFRHNCAPPNTFGLDACPKMMTHARLRNLYQIAPDATLIMLVRDQAEALLRCVCVYVCG